jgi:hypothetical protein
VDETGQLILTEESTNLVGGHEHLCKLLVVFEVDFPDRVTFSVESGETCQRNHQRASLYLLLVEPLQTTSTATCIHVGVCPLEVLEVEGALWQVVKRVFWFGLLFDKVIFIIFRLYLLRFLCLGFGDLFRLFLLLGLGRWDILQGFLNIRDLTKDSLDLGLVDDGLKVPGDVGKLCTGPGIEVNLENLSKQGCDVYICKGDAFANKEGVCAKVPIQCAVGAFQTFGEGLLELRREMSDMTFDQRLLGAHRLAIG